jgi:hypothetical protein
MAQGGPWAARWVRPGSSCKRRRNVRRRLRGQVEQPRQSRRARRGSVGLLQARPCRHVPSGGLGRVSRLCGREFGLVEAGALRRLVRRHGARRSRCHSKAPRRMALLSQGRREFAALRLALPESIRTEAVVTASFAWDGAPREIRVASVQIVGEDWLDLEDGWPVETSCAGTERQAPSTDGGSRG